MLDSTFDADFDITIQKKFLKLLIFDKNWAALNGLDIVQPEFFENKILHNICFWIHRYYKKHKNIPTQAVLKQDAQDYINTNTLSVKELYMYFDVLDEIFNLNDNEDLDYFKEKVVIFARQATWKKVLITASDSLKAGNYEEAIAAFKKVLSIGSENDLGLDFDETTSDQFIDLLKDSYDEQSMLKTGIKGWDNALGGGFVRRNVHLIGACFVGKTKIKTSKGNKSFEELTHLPTLQDLEIYSWKDGKKVKSKIKDVFITKETTQLIQLDLNNGKTVRCTPDHLFLIKNPKLNDQKLVWEGEIAYKKAEDLGDDDEL